MVIHTYVYIYFVGLLMQRNRYLLTQILPPFVFKTFPPPFLPKEVFFLELRLPLHSRMTRGNISRPWGTQTTFWCAPPEQWLWAFWPPRLVTPAEHLGQRSLGAVSMFNDKDQVRARCSNFLYWNTEGWSRIRLILAVNNQLIQFF